MRPLSRATPMLPVQAVKTYQVTSPPDAMVAAACKQVGCAHWRNGWDTHVDERTDLGMTQAAYIRQRSGRTFKELRTTEGLTVFRFEAHQRCFTEHRTRPELYMVRGGDWRQRIGEPHRYDRPDQWVDDFATHQDRIQTAIDKG